MKKKLFLSCFLLITTLSVFALGNKETKAGPPPLRENGQDSQLIPQGSGKIFLSLTTDYGESSFELTSVAVENGEILDAYKCEKKNR